MAQTIIKLEPDDFPAGLNQIPDPPKQLYVRGELPGAEYKYLAVVGSRKYSPYGREVCEKLISGLRGLPVVIVSGLALGMDSLAHRAALQAGLKTIAVPGSGLNDKVIYPQSHFGLAKQIIESGGALASEYEPDFKATLWSFPRRNRIMVGLSDAVLLVEAGEKSGTLITAKLAADYNRDLLAVPGSIFSATSKGTHQFIRLGATPITSVADLKEALGFTDEVTQKHLPIGETKLEQEIIDILQVSQSRQEVIDQLEYPISEINQTLALLEIKGVVKEVGGELHLT